VDSLALLDLRNQNPASLDFCDSSEKTELWPALSVNSIFISDLKEYYG